MKIQTIWSLLNLVAIAVASPMLTSCGGGGGGDGAGTVPQVVAQLVQQGYLKASNTESGDSLGRSIALDGDTLAVGAPSEDGTAVGVTPGSPTEGQTGNGASNSGAGYVFQPQ